MGTMFNSHEARACVSLPSLRESLRTCSYTEERATRDTPHRRVEWFVSETIEREFFEGRVRQKEQKICRACIVIEVQLLVTLPTYFVDRVRRP